MKILITGSTGLLGSTLLFNAPKKHVLGATYNINHLVPDVNCLYYHVDITNPQLIDRAFEQFKPDILIHTAAIATPDYCDKHQDEALSVNVEGTKNLLKACKKHKSAIVFITTNGVYDGKKPPYDEESIPNPMDFYGKTKLQGEFETVSSGVPFTIIRLITMYGWNNPNERQNPVTWQMTVLGNNKNPINMVTDMYNNFLSVNEATKAIWKSIDKKTYGEFFNIAGKDCISRYQFSLNIADTFNLDKGMITPVTLDYFNNYVERPKNTCFNTYKMEKILGIKPISSTDGLLYLKSHRITDKNWKKII